MSHSTTPELKEDKAKTNKWPLVSGESAVWNILKREIRGTVSILVWYDRKSTVPLFWTHKRPTLEVLFLLAKSKNRRISWAYESSRLNSWRLDKEQVIFLPNLQLLILPEPVLMIALGSSSYLTGVEPSAVIVHPTQGLVFCPCWVDVFALRRAKEWLFKLHYLTWQLKRIWRISSDLSYQ